jgi:lipid II:glycine glycyltransferase (peptidoglycan interpeptide bridge formation enzyme)
LENLCYPNFIGHQNRLSIMSVKIFKNNFSLYDEKAVHPLQSWVWGEARKKMGIEVLRLGEYHQDKLENVFQLTFHKLPFTAYKIGYLPRSVFPSKSVLEFLQDYGQKNKIIFIKIEPYIENSFKIENWKLKIVKSPHPLFPQWTQIIDLTKSEEELLKNMHPKTRYNMRLAQKKGVVVKEMSDDAGFEIFAKLYFETCRRQKYFGHTKTYHQIIWNSLKNKIAHFLCYYQDLPLAAYECFILKKTYYPTVVPQPPIATSCNQFAYGEAIKFGKKSGQKN